MSAWLAVRALIGIQPVHRVLGDPFLAPGPPEHVVERLQILGTRPVGKPSGQPAEALADRGGRRRLQMHEPGANVRRGDVAQVVLAPAGQKSGLVNEVLLPFLENPRGKRPATLPALFEAGEVISRERGDPSSGSYSGVPSG